MRLTMLMVASTAVIDLPGARAAGPVTQRRSDPVVTVTKAGDLYLGARKVDRANLGSEIKKALAEVGSETLLIRGDNDALLGAAVDVMATAKKAVAMPAASRPCCVCACSCSAPASSR